MDMLDIQSSEFYNLKAGDDCPGCADGKMVERYGRTADGTPFLGCSNYPKCTFTSEITATNT